MRTISYTCDRCGKKITSARTTKINATIYRGLDSAEKTNCDFCSPCFLKMKKAWKKALSMAEDKTSAPVKEDTKSVIIDELAPTQAPIITEEDKTESVTKKRGRKPKPVNTDEWKTRTEMVYGPIPSWEKDLILKWHAEEGLSPDEIAEKLHRLPRGIKRTINAVNKSGELDEVQNKVQSSSNASIFGSTRRSSYVGPADIEVIDGEKYDVGSIMAFHNAGWPSSKIAKEKGYDEDMVRVIIDSRKS